MIRILDKQIATKQNQITFVLHTSTYFCLYIAFARTATPFERNAFALRTTRHAVLMDLMECIQTNGSNAIVISKYTESAISIMKNPLRKWNE